MRVTHSLLHVDDLAHLVEREYAIAAPVTVSLLNRGFNDTYLVTDVEGGRRVLRVYNRGNTNIDGDGRFVTFDFDHCGFGLRAYDLVALYRGPDSPEEDRERWAAVLAGYQQVHPLSQSEVAGFPVLAACRAMWDIGDWLGATDRTGDAWVTEALIARLLADARKAESESTPAGRRGRTGADA